MRHARAGAVVCGAVLVSSAMASLVPSPADAATPPSAPRGLVASAGPGSGQVTLTWTTPSSTGGSKLTNFGYAKSTDGGATFSAVIWFNSTATSRSSNQVPALNCSTRANQKGCRYRVFARNAAGTSVASNIVTTWIVPSAPGNFRGTIDASYSTASLKWDRPGTTGAFTTLTYRLLRSVDGGPYSETTTTTALGKSVGCNGATTCAYKIYATNGQGNGPTTASAVTFGVAPSAVVGLAVTNTASNRGTGVSNLNTTWSRPTSGLAVDHYELQQCGTPAGATGACGAGAWGPVTNVTATTTSRTSTCSAVVSCSVMVRAVNARGGAGPASIVNLRPWAPFDVTAKPSGTGKATVRFRGPNDSGTGTPKSYSVFVCASTCGNASNWADSGLTVGHPRTDAAPHTAGQVTCAGTCQVRMQFNAGSAKSVLTPAVSGTGGSVATVTITTPAHGAHVAAGPVAVTGTCSGPLGGEVTAVATGPNTATASAPCSTSGSWQASFGSLVPGAYLLDASQTDAGGNTGPPAVQRTFHVDGAPGGTVVPDVVAGGLEYPAMFSFDSRSRIFFGELKTGEINIFDPANGTTSLFTSVSGLCKAADQGLFGVVPHPNYPSDPSVYAYATRLQSGICFNQLLRLTGADPLSPGGIPTTEVLFSQQYLGEHIGGRLAFGPDGLLYLSTGEGGDGEGGPSAAHSQDPSSGHGKILRFAPDGSVPSTNPVAGSFVYALGFRNVFGMTFDPESGGLWSTENGPACNDEINRITAGGNYGWGPTASCTTPPAAPGNTNRDGPSPIPPAFWYSPSNGPTGITFCAGCGLGTATEGALLFGQWQDGEIHALTLDAARTGVLSDTLVYRHSQSETPLSVETAPDGSVYFSSQNAIYRLRLAPST